MEPDEAREPSSAGADEVTIARRRSRRVSFAETTAVHVFDRDEDFVTPPDSKPAAAAENGAGRVVGFHGEHSDSEDSRGSMRDGEEDEEGEEDGEQERFIRDMDLSSPGSTVGSVTSNDDDNFFGPVSTSFIRSGRFSDGGMSEDNNPDITLDSTAFSLHFRNIAPPNDCSGISVGSIRTPTGDSMPADPGSSMVRTGFKKLLPPSTLSDGKISCSAGDSNYMSLISNNPDKYDYGKISPTLEALLAEVDKSMQPNSPNGVLVSEHNVNEVSDVNSSVKEDTQTGKAAASTDEAIDHCLGSHQLNVSSVGIIKKASLPRDSSPTAKTPPTVSPMRKDDSAGVQGIQSDIVATGTQNSDRPSPSDRVSENISQLEPVFEADGHQQPSEPEFGMHTPKNAVQRFQSSFQGSVSSLRAKRQKLFLESAVVSPGKLIQSPGKEQPPSSIKMELLRHAERISAIKNSISKFKVPETPKPASFRPSTSKNEHRSFELEGFLQSRSYDHCTKLSDFCDTHVVESLINTSKLTGGQGTSLELSRLGEKVLNDTRLLRQNKENDIVNGTVKSTEPASLFEFSRSEWETKGSPLSSQKPIQVFSSPKENQTMNCTTKVISSLGVMGKHDTASFHEGCSTPSEDQMMSSMSLPKENMFQSSTSDYFNKAGKLHAPNGTVSSHITSDNLCSEAGGWQDRHFNSQANNAEIGLNSARGTSSERSVIIDSLGSASDDIEATTLNKSIQFFPQGTAQNPADKIINSTVANISRSLDFVGPISPKTTEDQRHHGRDTYHEQQALSGSFSIEVRKRGIGQVVSHENDINEASRTQKSLKILPEFLGSINVYSGNGGACIVGGQAPPEHWNDILSKAFQATKELFAPSIATLSSKELDILEDMLGELQASRKYERLSTEIQSLRNHILGDPHHQRLAEARLLRDILVCEQAKLSIKRVKLVQLQSKVLQSQWAIQESHKLKTNLTKYKGPVQNKGRHLSLVPTTCKTNSQEQKIKVVSMRQELEMLDQKVKHLMKSFASSFKIKGNASCDGIVKVVSEHLEVKTHSRAVHQDLHLWKLSGLVNKKDQHDIVLNYCNMLSQRFGINIGPVPAIVVNNLLNDENIEKKFPSMNARLVFASVFNLDNDHRLTCSKSFQEQTSVTSFLLGNLLEVLDEVQVARIENSSLVSSSFQSECCQLALHLCFLCFKSGRRVTLGINMIDLKCAVYPSEPSHVHVKIIGAQSTLPASVMDEILRAVQILQNGRAMILRLCRSVSQVVQASS